jgi:Flp pilus assembly pilin Flp
MRPLLHSLGRIRGDNRGVASAEYAILAVGVVIIIGAALLVLADPNRSAFVLVGSTISSTQASMSANLPATR